MGTKERVIHFKFQNEVEKAMYLKDYVDLELMTDREVLAYNRICRVAVGSLIMSEVDYRINLMHMHITNEIVVKRALSN